MQQTRFYVHLKGFLLKAVVTKEQHIAIGAKVVQRSDRHPPFNKYKHVLAVIIIATFKNVYVSLLNEQTKKRGIRAKTLAHLICSFDEAFSLYS